MKGAALVAALSLAAGPASAAATEVSRADLAALSSAAASDSGALAELRVVTSVDGAPVDLEAALAGAEGAALDARLAALARSANAASPQGVADAAEARAQVVEILANDDLKPPEPGGDGVRLPNIPLGLAIVLALAIAAIAALTARSLGRRSVVDRERSAGPAPERASRPRDLEREADEAERRGDFGAAVRLRFQAGLMRLDGIGAIKLRPSLTAAGAVRATGSGRLAGLADSYERVAFGGREAEAPEAEEQRSGWSAVLREVRGR